MKGNCLKFMLLCFTLIGCKRGFYSYYGEGDLWRIPLIEPYELKNVAGSNETEWNDNWNLKFYTLSDRYDSSRMSINVNMVNVDKGYVYGYGTVNPSPPFLIDIKNREEKVYETQKEWETELRKKGLDPSNIYKIWSIFPNFRDRNVLPWDAQVRPTTK